MRILFDDRWLGPTGIGRYAAEVLRRAPRGNEIRNLRRDWAIKNPAAPWLMANRIRSERVDLFWSPGFMPPGNTATPSVVTVHDLIHLHFGSRLHRIYYDRVIRPRLHRLACVLTVSEYSRNEILEWSRLPPSRVIAIPLATAPEFCEDGTKYRLNHPYVLYVGNRRSYKNVAALVRGFALARIDPSICLALSGAASPDLLAVADKCGVGARLVFLGTIPEDKLASVYRGASAFAYLSLYEGFGLPPLEAMACGVPTLVSDATSLPEVVGEGALRIDARGIDAIADGLERIVNDEDLRARVMTAARLQVRRFSWERTALDTWTQLRVAALGQG